VPVNYQWRGPFESAEVSALHAEAFSSVQLPGEGERSWRELVERHSLGWVVARDASRLVGFVNVAWDGSAHAFIVDTMVAEDSRRGGIGTALMDLVRAECRNAGCEWLHVDFEKELGPFYFEACHFNATSAGLLRLR
jgi:GNAT superfamily N-acetyltransferase